MIGGVLMIIVGFMIRRYVIRKLRDYKEECEFGEKIDREEKKNNKNVSETKLRITSSHIEVHTDTLV